MKRYFQAIESSRDNSQLRKALRRNAHPHNALRRNASSRHSFVGGAAAIALLLLAACGKSNADTSDSASAAPRAQQLSPADVATADTSTLAAGVLVTGSLRPADVVIVRAQVSGTVERVRADRGTRVSEGQTLAMIQAAGVQSQALGAKAGVAAAKAGLALAQQKLDAATMLHKAGAISDVDLKAADAEFESAQAQLASATAQSAMAGENAARATVRSPLSGVVSDRKVQDGEAVSVGAELFTVVNVRELELAANVPVDEAAAVKVGQTVRFTLASMPSAIYTGRVDRKDPVANENSRQIGLYLRVPNPNGTIVAGQFATGRIVANDAKAVVVVPTGAVREGSGKFWVLRIDNGSIERRDVTVGTRDEAAGLVVITSGLAAGDRVITSPAMQLSAGTRVSIASDSAR